MLCDDKILPDVALFFYFFKLQDAEACSVNASDMFSVLFLLWEKSSRLLNIHFARFRKERKKGRMKNEEWKEIKVFPVRLRVSFAYALWMFTSFGLVRLFVWEHDRFFSLLQSAHMVHLYDKLEWISFADSWKLLRY